VQTRWNGGGVKISGKQKKIQKTETRNTLLYYRPAKSANSKKKIYESITKNKQINTLRSRLIFEIYKIYLFFYSVIYTERKRNIR